MGACIIRIPSEHNQRFLLFWKELRIAEALSPENDLHAPTETENFDGSTMAEWVVPLAGSVLPLLTAVLGYLVAVRGEIEIRRGDSIIKMKNMSPSQLKKIIAILNGDKNGDT